MPIYRAGRVSLRTRSPCQPARLGMLKSLGKQAAVFQVKLPEGRQVAVITKHT